MKNALTITQIAIRTLGTIVLILGLLFWAGLDPNLVKIHIVLGVMLVVALLVLAFLGLRTKAPLGLVILDVGWSAVLPALGLTQAQIFLGPAHEVIHILHLLVGIGALWQAEMLGSRIKEQLETLRTTKHPVRRVRVRS